MVKSIVVLAFVFASFSTWAQLKFTGISTGIDYLCAHNESKVYCWGSSFQQLDNLSNIKKIETAGEFGCISDDIGLACFGNYPVLQPEMLEGDISDFDVAGDDVCALLNGKLMCTGTTRLIGMPKDLDRISSVKMSGDYTCVIQDEKVYCWGSLYSIGAVPQDLGKVVKIDLFSRWACALNRNNKLNCWDLDGIYDRMVIPENLGQIVDFNLSLEHGCLINAEGQVRCWPIYSGSPFSIPTSSKAIQISSGGAATCALDEEGQIKCAGFLANRFRMPPILTESVQLFATNQFGVCFTQTGKIVCSGADTHFPLVATGKVKYLASAHSNLCYIDETGPHCLENANTSNPQIAKIPTDLKNIKDIFLGFYSACATTQEGKFKCWGMNYRGVATPPADLNHVKKVVMAYSHACALTEAGKVVCWGNSQNYKQHTETYLDIALSYDRYCLLKESDEIECVGTTPPTHLLGIKFIVSGDSFFCAASDTEIACWGGNVNNILIPPKVVGKIKSLKTGDDFACLEDSEKVKCWGNNVNGQYTFFQNELVRK